jgi:hypothetical protein
MWLWVNKHKISGKLTFYSPCHITSAKEGLPPWILCMQAMSPIQGRQTPMNRRVSCGRHRDWRAHEQANRLKRACTPGTYLGTHPTATRRKHRPCGAQCPASTWYCLVGPGVHSWGVGGASTRPITRRGGTHFLPKSHSNSSLNFGFQFKEVG